MAVRAHPEEAERHITSWKPHQHARPSAKALRAHYPGATSLGLMCGPKPRDPDADVAALPGLECIDFDDRETYTCVKAEAGAVGLLDLITRIEDGYCDDTPGGGVRWLYRCADVPGNLKLAERPAGKGSDVLIETRGVGGYCIVAPTAGENHESGRPYVRRSGSFASILTISVEERAALIAFFRTFDELSVTVEADALWRRSDRSHNDGLRPGDDFNSRSTWAEVLEPHGWIAMSTRHAGAACWRRPGKQGPGISATTDYRGSNVLKVFSTSTAFDTVKSYTKFAAFAVLNYGGDYAAAAKALVGQGYGTPTNTTGRDGGKADRGAGAAENHDQSPRAGTSVAGRRQAREREVPWPRPLRPEAFHGVLGEITQALAPQTEADPAAILVQLLVMFGSMLGRTAHFTVAADTHFLNLFAGIVGRTAKGRKGLSHGLARQLFEAVDPAWFARCTTSGLSSGEGLIWAIRDEIKKDAAIKERGGRVVEYQEVIDDAGVLDKRLLVTETEFAGPIKCMHREGNTLSVVIRQAWDGHRLKTSTKNSPGTATDPHVSIIGHITRDELRRYLDVTETANGLGNRFLWICVQRSRLLPEGGDTVDLERYVPQVRRALVFGQSLCVMVRDPDATRLWGDRLYPRLTAERPGMYGSMTSRAEALVMRLACLYAITELSDTVGVRHLNSALAVWAYADASARYLFDGQLGDSVADEILRLLRDAAPNAVSRTDMTQAFRRNRTASEITRALMVLADSHLARQVAANSPSAGRPAELWTLVTDEENEENEETTHGPEDGNGSPPAADQRAEGSFVSLVSLVTPSEGGEVGGEVMQPATIAVPEATEDEVGHVEYF